MDEFIIENVDRYKKLVNSFRPPASAEKAEKTVIPNPDVVVSVRIRPILDSDGSGMPQAAYSREQNDNVVDLHELRQEVRGPPTIKSSEFKVDRAFGPTDETKAIYESLVKPLVPWAWNGGVGTLFAYGQTGSGKTYTISRLEELVAGSLFNDELLGERKIRVTLFELAGKAAYDLLNARKQVSVLEDSFGVTQIAGAVEHTIDGAEDFLTLIQSATAFRQTASTEKNDASSRSHAICRVRIENVTDPAAEDGMLYLIDLAGSEAARDRAKHGADRMRETREINSSLSTLKDCIRGRAEADMASMSLTASKRKPYVPFRQAQLTKVLKHVFDPAARKSCKTVVIACINPSLADIRASKGTLKYAEMLRVLLPKPKQVQYDSKTPMTWTNGQLKTWISENSGDPAVSAELLAPTETGAQLLVLPPVEFETRCIRTEGVVLEQAKAFRSKLWQMHVDSQHDPKEDQPSAAEDTGVDTILGHLSVLDRSSSREPDQAVAKKPFKDRLRPGMVVSWSPPGNSSHVPRGLNMVLLLCPSSSVPQHVTDMKGTAVDKTGSRWLCSMISPAPLAEAYELNMWRHIVVDVEAMDKEIILEYESGTRYYYMAV